MSCETRARLFKYQERTREQFSLLWRSCEARASVVMCGKNLIKTPRGCCEARASLFHCKEWSRKQFSPLWRSCGARASLFMSQEKPRKTFHHSGGSVKLMHACLCAWKASQSGFNLPRSLVKLVQINLNIRKDLERSFLHSGGPVMFV